LDRDKDFDNEEKKSSDEELNDLCGFTNSRQEQLDIQK
jgi:hypothetical protein